MRWKKLGLVWSPDGMRAWARTHAMIPTPIALSNGRLRCYVTCCDDEGIGRCGYVDLDAEDPTKVIGSSRDPVLDIGKPGTFDENGVLACSVLEGKNGALYMYYAGFELGRRIRYRLLTGLAISDDGGATFHRSQSTPILERSESELFFRGGPFVAMDRGVFRLWYVAGSTWTDVAGKLMPVYTVKYSESSDGIRWPAEGRTLLGFESSDEHGFGRPWVIRTPSSGYAMYYSIRRRSLGAYRLGYAESSDGIRWVRMDSTLNLDVSDSGFDSAAIMYSAVVDVAGRSYCFYNGNDFGRGGFALALRVE